MFIISLWECDCFLRSAVTFINCALVPPCFTPKWKREQKRKKENRGKPFGNCCACHACRDTTTANPINFLLLIYAAKAHLAMSSNRPGRDRKRAHPHTPFPSFSHTNSKFTSTSTPTWRPNADRRCRCHWLRMAWPGPACDWGRVRVLLFL